MSSTHRYRPTIVTFCVLAAMILSPDSRQQADEADAPPVFASSVVDLGIVVSDLDKSVAFYKEALGCQEARGFSVPGNFAGRLGLSDNHGLTVRVLTPGDGAAKTRLKLMAFPEAAGAKTDQRFIHSSLGFSYLTFQVTDLSASIAKLKKAKVKMVGESPMPLGGGRFIVLCRDPDGNFVELIGPMN